MTETLPLFPPNQSQFDFDSARALPPNIRFGGSSWTYPGWKGIIYFDKYRNDKEFRARSLEEYAKFPWFRSVGIDSAFYAPLSSTTLKSYAAMVPPDFQWVSKVWEHITIPKYPSHPRYGTWAGKENSDFLNAELFIKRVLGPYDDETIKPHAGPFVFQFPTFSKAILGNIDFLEKLSNFLEQLPKTFRYATEIRNPELLSRRYFEVLNRVGVTHCFNHWHIMPTLIEQMKKAAEIGGLTAPFYVARILTPLGVSYEGAVKLFEPYTSIKQPNQQMREDVVRLAKRAIERKVDAFIIVNNRCEGHSPGTIDAIGRMIVT